jgi:1,4-alpha-glucan branching enzyme
LKYPVHKGLQDLVKELNHLYRSESALYENQFDKHGFEWIEADDLENSVYVYLRKGKRRDDILMTVLNLAPKVLDYKIKVPTGTHWEVIFNSDDEEYNGSGVTSEILEEKHEDGTEHQKFMTLKLPPLAGIILRQQKDKKYKLHRIKHKR